MLFDAKSFNELLFKIVLSTPPSPLAIVPDLDPAFASIISKGMARDVEHRFQTATQFAEAVDNWARTGAAVTVPPEHRQPGATPPVVHAATPNLGASGPSLGSSGLQGAAMPGPGAPRLGASGHAVPKQSAQSWATSQPDVAEGVPRPSKGPVFAIAAIAALVVLGGGAFAGYKLMGGGAKTETTQAVITATPEPPKAAAEPPKAALIDPPPAPPPASPEAKAPDAKANETAASTVAPPPKVDLRAAAPVRGRPPPPRPGPTPGPKPPAKPGAPDFGY